jgi:hypothetical protein
VEEKFKNLVNQIKCKYQLPQKANGTVVQHLRCPETTFYLPLLEFELLQEPAMEQNNLC